VPGPELSPLQRLALAFYAFFAILFRAEFAGAVHRVRQAHRAGALPPPSHAPEPRSAPEPVRTPATKPAAVPSPAPEPSRAPAAAAAPAPMPAKPAEVPKPVEAVKPVAAPKVVEAPKPAPAPAKPAEPDPRAALQLLAVLQREGRLVDFVEEDLTGFPDASIGAAARTVHAGCKRALEEYFRLEPVFRDPEGARVTVPRGFDPAAIRLTGNVVGEAPFQGALRHHGWRAKEVRVPAPREGADATLVAPAEVELG
jgi:Domain of unknown function (DUF2760)